MWVSSGTMKNWAGNFAYSSVCQSSPLSLEEIQEAVHGAKRVKALGTRHSFNAIADTPGHHLSLARMDTDIVIESQAGGGNPRVTIGGGLRYGELAPVLHRAGYALQNLPSLPHISVVGAVLTGTHGSGDGNGVLATSVESLECVVGDGSVVTFERGQSDFEGAVLSLGALGVVTRVTLKLLPTFEVRQDVYEDLAFDAALEYFDELFASGYSVSLFTDWQGTTFNQVWLKRRVEHGGQDDAEPVFYGAKRASRPLHPVAGLAADACTEQLGRPGPWHERLPHFRLEFVPSTGKELQSEYFVSRKDAVAALEAVRRLKNRIAPLLQICEIRTVREDDLWMSPCYRRPSVAIHFTWKPDWEGVRPVLQALEEVLKPFGVRPHWAKLFTLSPEYVRAQYPRHGKFLDLLCEYDPQGKFRNPFLDTYVYGDR